MVNISKSIVTLFLKLKLSSNILYCQDAGGGFLPFFFTIFIIFSIVFIIRKKLIKRKNEN